jgi:hypothetical protein
MDQSTNLAIGLTGLGVIALVWFALYRSQQRARIRGVKGWVDEYLAARYGAPPGDLTVNCSDDPLWPVLVAFAHPRTGARHRLQFACPGGPRTFALRSEMEGGQ